MIRARKGGKHMKHKAQEYYVNILYITWLAGVMVGPCKFRPKFKNRD